MKFNRITLPLLSWYASSLFAFILLSSSVRAQDKITLQQAIDLALQNNIQVKQAALGEALSAEDLNQSKYALYPNLNAGSNLNFNFGRSEDPTTRQFVNQSITTSNGSISSSMLLFQGFQKVNLIKQNKYLLEADRSNTKKAKNDLVLSVVTTYLTILNNRDLLAASQQQLDISKQLLDRVQKLFNVGNNTLADLAVSKSQIATAELNSTNAQNQLDIAYLNLAQLMERDPNSKFEVVTPEVEKLGELKTDYAASEVFAQAAKVYPDIQLAGFRTLAFQKAVDVAKGNYYPRLSVGASLGSGYSNTRSTFSQTPNGFENYGFVTGTGQVQYIPKYITTQQLIPFGNQVKQNFNQTIGFSLNIPIFNGFSARSSVTRAKINFQNAQYSEQLAKNNLDKIINQAVLDLRAAEKNYASTQSAFASSKEAFNVIQQRYNVGLVNSLDFNQSQTNLNTAQFNLIQARYNLIFRSKVIDYYLGNPITF